MSTSCITAQFGNTYCPQLRLTITSGTDTATSTSFSWKLEYVAHGYAFYASAKAVTATFDGATLYSGSYAINGKTGTYTIASGTKTITKGTSGRHVPASCSINFGSASWNGVTGGSRSASTTQYVGPKSSYTVTYNANGGSGAPGSQTKWYGTNITLSSSKPTRTGYTFAGWATSASGAVAYQPGATYSANANVTLYAKWTAITYTVSYNANGGTGAPGNQTKTYGVTLTLSATKPTRTNYNFKGWATSAGSTTVAYAAGASYTANAAVTLYAVWELAYTAPRITNLKADRCNSAGTLDDDGTYAKVTFSWATDRTISSIKVAGVAVSASGTSGSVSKVVGGSYSAETAYSISVAVADSGGTTTVTTTLAPMTLVIDFLKGGKGVAFGKPATTQNLASAFPVAFDKTLTVAGLATLNGGFKFRGNVLASNTDLNNVTEPGFYYQGTTSVVATMAHVPEATACGLEVFQASGVIQRFTTYSTSDPRVYIRSYYSYAGTWGAWIEITKKNDLNDMIKVQTVTLGSLTLAAHAGKALTYTAPTVSGYTLVKSLGVKGVGDVGLMGSPDSSWVFNASASQKTYTSVVVYFLYVKSSF